MNEFKTTSRKDFEEKLRTGVTLVDFNAPWCAPCRAQEPVIAKLEEVYNGRATIGKLNIDENQEIAMALGIQSIPTIIIFKEGKEYRRFVGLQTAETLAGALGNALNP